MSDVDWALERLADEIDVLQSRLAAVTVGPEVAASVSDTNGETNPADDVGDHALSRAISANKADAGTALPQDEGSQRS